MVNGIAWAVGECGQRTVQFFIGFRANPRDGDPQYEQAKALMVAIDAILRDAAGTRAGASKPFASPAGSKRPRTTFPRSS